MTVFPLCQGEMGGFSAGGSLGRWPSSALSVGAEVGTICLAGDQAESTRPPRCPGSHFLLRKTRWTDAACPSPSL